MKVVFITLAIITFLFIGMAFVCAMAGHAPWGALFMTGSIITAALCACAGADIYEYKPRRRTW